ncbi:MAG TPA: hypothetical protein VNR41_10155 [Xanthobacteraceae bacterium]|jgi:hypothetical protein|nr:hypothetical protein [Xanthobacteraceae bacterium]
MSRPANIRCLALLGLAGIGMLAAGCSDLYYDRRDTIALSAGDAVATNIVAHTIDVWPIEAGDQRIVTNGQKAQGAVERYRTNKVTVPHGTGTSSLGYQQPSSSSQPAPSVSQ